MEKKMFIIFNESNGSYLQKDSSWSIDYHTSLFKLFFTEEEADRYIKILLEKNRLRRIVGSDSLYSVGFLSVFENMYLLNCSDLTREEAEELFCKWDPDTERSVFFVSYHIEDGYFITYGKRHTEQSRLTEGFFDGLYYI